MKYISSFIGAGHMGGTLLLAAAKSAGKQSVVLCGKTSERSKALAEKYGCDCCSAKEAAVQSKFIFIGVKPIDVPKVLEDIKDSITEDSVIVSMAAGIKLDTLYSLSRHKKIIRIMPNTPCAVGEGMLLYCASDFVSERETEEFSELMRHCGVCYSLPEKQMDAASALTGCGPAFVYMFIDALADGAVKCGLPKDTALSFAKQTVLGSAALAVKSEKHPEELKDDVCSPGGSTIEGVLELEKNSFRSTAAGAVAAAFEKTKKLGKV